MSYRLVYISLILGIRAVNAVGAPQQMRCTSGARILMEKGQIAEAAAAGCVGLPMPSTCNTLEQQTATTLASWKKSESYMTFSQAAKRYESAVEIAKKKTGKAVYQAAQENQKTLAESKQRHQAVITKAKETWKAATDAANKIYNTAAKNAKADYIADQQSSVARYNKRISEAKKTEKSALNAAKQRFDNDSATWRNDPAYSAYEKAMNAQRQCVGEAIQQQRQKP